MLDDNLNLIDPDIFQEGYEIEVVSSEEIIENVKISGKLKNGMQFLENYP